VRRTVPAALLLMLAVIAAPAAAEPPPDLWARIDAILASEPEVKAQIDQIRALAQQAGEAAPAGWDRMGIDSDALLAARPGGRDGNLLVVDGAPGAPVDAELRTSRPLAELVPAGWTEIVRMGEVDFHPRHDAILFIASLDESHVAFSRARHWRQGRASCWGPTRGIALYRRAGAAPAADPAALLLSFVAMFAPGQGLALCETFDGDAQAGLTRTRALLDGRPLTEQNRRLTARSVIRPMPIADLFAPR
jgi:hypothetical protein